MAHLFTYLFAIYLSMAVGKLGGDRRLAQVVVQVGVAVLVQGIPEGAGLLPDHLLPAARLLYWT